MSLKILNKKGDTIVEVMLAMTVLAMVIGGAYSIANRGMIASQQAQQRITATKIAEAQLERLKYISTIPTSDDPAVINPTLPTVANQCIDANNLTKPNGSIVDNPDCWQDEIFNFYFEQVSPTFKLVVKWDSFHSSTQDNVVMYYRVN